MKKNSQLLVASLTFLFTLVLASSVAPQVFALKIEMSSTGVASFYQDTVLGRDDDKEAAVSKQGERTKMEYKEAPFRESTLRNKTLTVEPRQEDVRVEIRDDSAKPAEREKEFERVETMEAKRLELNAPVAPSELQKREAEARREETKQNAETKREEVSAQQNRDRKTKEIRTNNAETYQTQIQTQRDSRKDELLSIKNEFDETQQKQQVKLTSREVGATLHEGAQFSYDPDSNEVRIVTPSGETKTLTHLPDQALARMQETGLITSANKPELEIRTDENGEVSYKTSIKKEKRFLGLFPREVETEIELHDGTGDLVETENLSENAWESLLDRLSI